MNEQVEAYKRKAIECERKALLITNEGIRCSYLQLAWHWRDMARYIAAVDERRELKGPQLP